MCVRTISLVLGILLLAMLVLTPLARAFSRAPQPMTQQQAAQAGNHFAWDIYQQLKNRQGNLFFSPASIDLALAMTWTGARGETARDMGSVLHLPGAYVGRPESVSAAYGSLQAAMSDDGAPYTLRIANRLWGQRGYRFLDSFLEPLDQDFGAGLQELDFKQNSEGARLTINAWVEDKTEDKIKDLLQPGSLGSDVRLVLTNAIYFLGDWQRKFQGSDTADRTFHLFSDQEIRVPTMHQTNRFAYAETGQVQVVSLPYRDGDLEMVVVLPRDVEGLAAIEQELSAATLAGWTGDMKNRSVRLWLPKFSLTGEFSLAKILGQMGMASAFSHGADFSGMSQASDLFISDVVHKSFIDVFEKGTEAAAATAVTIRTTSMPGMAPDTVRFVADHPFLFLIRHTETGSILFLGRVTDPRG